MKFLEVKTLTNRKFPRSNSILNSKGYPVRTQVLHLVLLNLHLKNQSLIKKKKKKKENTMKCRQRFEILCIKKKQRHNSKQKWKEEELIRIKTMCLLLKSSSSAIELLNSWSRLHVISQIGPVTTFTNRTGMHLKPNFKK